MLYMCEILLLTTATLYVQSIVGDNTTADPTPVETLPTTLSITTSQPPIIPTKTKTPKCVSYDTTEVLQCFDSRACYTADAICDTYDDCGTKFDESNCNSTVLGLCSTVESSEIIFDQQCTLPRQNISAEPLSINSTSNGRLTFIIPTSSFPILGLESVVFNASIRGFYMFDIATISAQTGSTLNLTNLTIEVTEPGVISKKIRTPILTDPALVGSVQVSLYGGGIITEGTPYPTYSLLTQLPPDAVSLGFVGYRDQCAATFDIPGRRNPCLKAAWNFLEALRTTSESGATCQPRERTAFFSSLYSSCFSPAAIISITDDQTGFPGRSVTLACQATGSPQPIVSWWTVPPSPDSMLTEPIASGIGLATLTVTLTNHTNTSYECTANNGVGQMAKRVRITATDFRCISKSDELATFQNNLPSPCPSTENLNSPLETFNSNFISTLPTDAFIYSIRIPSQLLLIEFTEQRLQIVSFRVTVTTDRYLRQVTAARRKRDIRPVVYERNFANHVLDLSSDTVVVVDFTVPVYMPAGSVYVNLLTLDDRPFPVPFQRGDVYAEIQYLQCSRPLDSMNNTCYETHDEWNRLENEFIELGCADQPSTSFRAYRQCLQIADRPPIVREMETPVINLEDSFTLSCPIEGSIQPRWWKITSRGNQLPFSTPSSLLRFEGFHTEDQGYYYCEGSGGGTYKNQTVTSKPMLIALNDVTTLAFSLTFNEEYTDISDTQNLQLYRSLIQNAIEIGNDAITRSVVGNTASLNFPTIVNTRNGSLIVDYLISFNSTDWQDGNDLINAFTSRLRDHLTNVSFELQVVSESLVVGSASSCLSSTISGGEGTLTFRSAGLDQVVESVERCSLYTVYTDTGVVQPPAAPNGWRVNWTADYQSPANYVPFNIPGEIQPDLTVVDIIDAVGEVWRAPSLVDALGRTCVYTGQSLARFLGSPLYLQEICDPVLAALRNNERVDAEAKCRKFWNFTTTPANASYSIPTTGPSQEPPNGIAALRSFDIVGHLTRIAQDLYGLVTYDQDTICSVVDTVLNSDKTLPTLVTEFGVELLKVLIPRGAEICNSWTEVLDLFNSPEFSDEGSSDSPQNPVLQAFSVDIPRMVAYAAGYASRDALCNALISSIDGNGVTIEYLATNIMNNILKIFSDANRCASMTNDDLNLVVDIIPDITHDNITAWISQYTGLASVEDVCSYTATAFTGREQLPRATRMCRGDFLTAAVWDEPIYRNCFPDEYTNELLIGFAKTPVNAENVMEFSGDLVNATSHPEDISSEGLEAVAIALRNIVEVGDPSVGVTTNVIMVVDNVLHVDSSEYVGTDEAPSTILDSLEDQVTLLQTQGDRSNLTFSGRNIAVMAYQFQESAVENGLAFASVTPEGQGSQLDDELTPNATRVFFEADQIPTNMVDASILLPGSILDFLPPYRSDNEPVPISFYIFQNDNLFQSSKQPNDMRMGRRIGSRVISATLEGAVVVGLPFGEEVETSFFPLNVTTGTEQIDGRTCVFWDKTLNGGKWSSEGCRREDRPDINRIRCLCDHLTSFAVLLDVSGDIGIYFLDVLSTIGCSISIVCLIITIITYLAIKKFRSKQPQRILINLCVALLGLYLVFVIGIDRRYPTGGCVAVGFLIHFFLLASIAWMLVEAVNMYLLFVKVLDASISRFMVKACLCAWGIPFVVCIVIVAVDYNLYLGDGTHCFVKPGPALYFGVMLPVALCMLVNFVIFGIIIQRLSCRRSMAAHKAKTSDRQETWRRLQNALAISTLLGLTWIFGLLAIGGARLLFNVLFLIFNSLQGFFVFLMFCVRQKEVRTRWMEWLRCRCAKKRRKGDYYIKSGDRKIVSSSASSQDAKTTLPTNGHDRESIPLSSGATLSTNASVN